MKMENSQEGERRRVIPIIADIKIHQQTAEYLRLESPVVRLYTGYWIGIKECSAALPSP